MGVGETGVGEITETEKILESQLTLLEHRDATGSTPLNYYSHDLRDSIEELKLVQEACKSLT